MRCEGGSILKKTFNMCETLIQECRVEDTIMCSVVILSYDYKNQASDLSAEAGESIRSTRQIKPLTQQLASCISSYNKPYFG